MTTCVTLGPGTGLFHLPFCLRLELGGELCGGQLAFELVGPPRAPLIVVLGGISAGRHVAAGAHAKGWWRELAGPGAAIDTRRFRVLGLDFLGGDGASTGPANSTCEPFPALTSQDQARALALLLDHLEIETAAAFVGASYGGMVGLAFAALFPERVATLVAISAPDRPHPLATAWRSLQRRIVALGLEHGAAKEAQSIARGLGMTTYRSVRELGERFDRRPYLEHGEPRFAIEDYLDARGEAFASSFDARAFSCLSRAIDLHRIEPEEITVPTTLVGVTSDRLVRIEQLRFLAARLRGRAELIEIDSLFGHDAFLKEDATMARILDRTLSGVEEES